VAYEVAVITAPAGNPTIDPKFFDTAGRLLPPNEISDDDWSMYDAELSVYLAPFGPINDQIRQFGRTFQRIAS
jgi:hypothetical protein